MIAAEFRAAGLALFGPGWPAKMAAWLKVNPRTVRRWADGEAPIPMKIEAALNVRPRIAREYPDEWLVAAAGQEEDTREYIVHLAPPRFIARFGEAAAAEGLVISLADEEVFDFSWIDPQPAEDELRLLARQMQIAIDDYSAVDFE